MWDEGRPGDYMRVLAEDGSTMWLAVRTPDGHDGTVRTHTITDESDGTITVSPSVLCTKADHGHDWHGYLERGVWREV